MKKALKKRISRRKRRISEREIMRIKRKLKTSARKLRLGAKRTGAYVYGTLRRIVGNPYTADQRRRIVEAINECNAYIRKESARRADIRPREAQEHLDFCIAHKQKLLKMLGYDVAERYLRGNPYSKTRGWYGPKATQGMTPQEKLRYYVSGAIARGEAEPIVGTPAHRPIPQVEPAWKYGIYTGRGVVRKNPATKARPIPGKFYRVYWSHPSRGETGQITFTGDQLLKIKSVTELSRYWPIKEGLKMAKVHFRGPYDSWDDAFMDR